MAVAKTELDSKDPGSTGRDAAADKLSELEKQREELLARPKAAEAGGAPGSSNEDIIRVQKQIKKAKRRLQSASNERSVAKWRAKLKKLKAEKNQIMRQRRALAMQRAKAKEQAKTAPMEGKRPDTPDPSEPTATGSAANGEGSVAANAPMTYTREAPYDMEYLEPADSHATAMPETGDLVLVHYSAKISPEWDLIDSSFKRRLPITFTVGSPDIIEGWDYAVKHLGVGQSARFRVPAELAYPQGFPPVVRADSVIEYEMQLLSFSKAKT